MHHLMLRRTRPDFREQHRSGHVTTPYLKFGETVRMEMMDDVGQSIFGAIENRIVQALPVEEALSS